MEQHSAPLSQPSRRRDVPPQATPKAPGPRSERASRQGPPPGVRRPAAARRPAGSPRTPEGGPLARLSQMRLTALGSGLLTVTVMLAVGGLCALLLDGSATAYGVGFVLAGLASALWVRPADVFTAPVAAPIAYACGLALISGGGGEGFGGRVMALVTALAVNAGWVWGGTLLTGLAALVRRVTLTAARRRARRAGGPKGDGSR
ncbi:hypothetical protein QNO07_24740 [Streptomyces sp. 549]|uniref:DUF6542 domain-containing protein n=1 Tax=Streptomyces sp. 549 TaxID=3049076 RepID=UPI0024C2245C|nr:DUF6542 domain-containing protein [Streptomyces sp. 549]MDK1476572.1 hypothetical protein [Streptomyces sp. 549]